jgi:N-acetylglucosamine-6-sulfatase
LAILQEAAVTTRKVFLLRSAAAAAGLSLFGLGKRDVAEAATRPNVLVVFTDDQPPFGSIERMPFVREFFVENGLVYDRAYLAGPRCAPSRATMQLGRYPHSHNIIGNKGAAGQYKNAGRQNESVARRLHEAGYSTALIGKWMNGYDNLMGTNSGWAHPYFDQWWVVLGNEDPVEVNSNGDIKVTDTCLAHETDLLRERCEEFIRNHRHGPWVCWATLKAPHGPYTPSPQHENAFSNEPLYRRPNYDEEDVSDKPSFVRDEPRSNNRNDLDNERRKLQINKWRELLDVDDAVRALWSVIQNTGQADRTYLIYAIDNGYMNGEHRLDKKAQSYEESSRNPLMVRGPAVAQGHIQAYSSLVDVPATIADLAGIGPFGEGRSLVPTFGGTVQEDWRKRVFFEMPTFPWYGVRDDSLEGELAGDWKYIENRNLENREIELYDMDNDPYELSSLHRERPDVCAGREVTSTGSSDGSRTPPYRRSPARS